MNSKKKIIILITVLITLFIFGTFIINIYMISKTENKIMEVSMLDANQEYDAILVLGCKAYSDRPSMMLENRLKKAYDVYQLMNTKVLLSGDHGKKDYDEVNVMRDYLLNYSIPKEDIFLDHAGFSTYDSIYRAKYVFKANNIIIITQRYHLYRSLYLAEKLGLNAIGIVADDIPYKGIMLKNEIREILSRDKNFFKGIIKPESKYLGEIISLKQDGTITEG